MLFFNRFQRESTGVPGLEGSPSREETVARYEELSGHKVKHLHYYEVYAGFRFIVIGVRLAQQRVYYEMATEEEGYAAAVNSIQAQLTAKLLDLPAPATYGAVS